MAIKFMSPEWEAEMQKRLAEEFSTRGLVSCTFAQIMTDGPDGQDHWAFMEVKKGRYVDYRIGVGEPPKYDIAAIGKFDIHLGCVKGEIDGSECVPKGQMRLVGNVAKGLTLVGTYSRLEAVEQSIEVE